MRVVGIPAKVSIVSAGGVTRGGGRAVYVSAGVTKMAIGERGWKSRWISSSNTTLQERLTELFVTNRCICCLDERADTSTGVQPLKQMIRGIACEAKHSIGCTVKRGAQPENLVEALPISRGPARSAICGAVYPSCCGTHR